MEKEYIAMIFSMLGMAVNIFSFQVKNKKPLLIFQTIGNVLFLISFIFNVSVIAVILNVIYVIRNFVYMRLDGKKGKPMYITCVILCVAFLTSYTVYTALAGHSLKENLWNFVPIIASIFGTIASACVDVNKYRMWKYGDSISCFLFNSLFGLGALGGIIGEVFNQISLAVALIRYRKKTTDTESDIEEVTEE